MYSTLGMPTLDAPPSFVSHLLTAFTANLHRRVPGADTKHKFGPKSNCLVQFPWKLCGIEVVMSFFIDLHAPMDNF